MTRSHVQHDVRMGAVRLVHMRHIVVYMRNHNNGVPPFTFTWPIAPIWNSRHRVHTILHCGLHENRSNGASTRRTIYNLKYNLLHDAFIRAIWLIHMCNMTYARVRYDSFICATWRMNMSPCNGVPPRNDMCDMTYSNAKHAFATAPQPELEYATWHAHMTHSYVRHDSFLGATYRICIHMGPLNGAPPRTYTYTCDLTYSYAGHDSDICATWRIEMCDMMYSYIETRHNGAPKFVTNHLASQMTSVWLHRMCDDAHKCLAIIQFVIHI